MDTKKFEDDVREALSVINRFENDGFLKQFPPVYRALIKSCAASAAASIISIRDVVGVVEDLDS